MKKVWYKVLFCVVFVALLAGCDKHTHSLIHIPARASTCAEAGNIEHWKCADCYKRFADAEGRQGVTEVALPKSPHAPENDDRDCTTEMKCLVCDDVLIPARKYHIASADDGDCTTDVLCKYCTAIVISGYESHIGGTPTCAQGAVCDRCQMPYGEKDRENHTGPYFYESDEIAHSMFCQACDGTVTEDVDHQYENGICICGMRKAHPNTLRISAFPEIAGKTVWQEEDMLLLSIHSHLFGTQTVTALYGEDGSWTVRGNAYWKDNETPKVNAWYAPNHILNADGTLSLRSGAQAGAEECLFASCATGEDDVLEVDFSVAREYSALVISARPNMYLLVNVTAFTPAGAEEQTESAVWLLQTDGLGVAYLYGSFAAGGRVYVTDMDSQKLAEHTFAGPTVPGADYLINAPAAGYHKIRPMLLYKHRSFSGGDCAFVCIYDFRISHL